MNVFKESNIVPLNRFQNQETGSHDFTNKNGSDNKKHRSNPKFLNSLIKSDKSFHVVSQQDKKCRMGRLSSNIFVPNGNDIMNFDELCIFRTRICPLKAKNDSCKLEDCCPFSHCLSWHRRNPRIINYRPTLCPNVLFMIGPNKRMRVQNHCRRGRLCTNSHTKEEQMYHPLVYKTQLCREWPNCQKEYCPFAHGNHEIRQPEDAKILLYQQFESLNSNLNKGNINSCFKKIQSLNCNKLNSKMPTLNKKNSQLDFKFLSNETANTSTQSTSAVDDHEDKYSPVYTTCQNNPVVNWKYSNESTNCSSSCDAQSKIAGLYDTTDALCCGLDSWRNCEITRNSGYCDYPQNNYPDVVFPNTAFTDKDGQDSCKKSAINDLIAIKSQDEKSFQLICDHNDKNLPSSLQAYSSAKMSVCFDLNNENNSNSHIKDSFLYNLKMYYPEHYRRNTDVPDYLASNDFSNLCNSNELGNLTKSDSYSSCIAPPCSSYNYFAHPYETDLNSQNDLKNKFEKTRIIQSKFLSEPKGNTSGIDLEVHPIFSNQSNFEPQYLLLQDNINNNDFSEVKNLTVDDPKLNDVSNFQKNSFLKNTKLIEANEATELFHEKDFTTFESINESINFEEKQNTNNYQSTKLDLLTTSQNYQTPINNSNLISSSKNQIPYYQSNQLYWKLVSFYNNEFSKEDSYEYSCDNEINKNFYTSEALSESLPFLKSNILMDNSADHAASYE